MSGRPSPGTRSWARGDQVALREIFRGRIWTARPATIADVGEDLTAVYLAPGTEFRVPAVTHRADILRTMHEGWDLGPYTWTSARMLHLLYPEAGHAIHLWWLPPDWEFGGWYINLQEPIRPTTIGFDSMDHILDVVIDRDLSWHWKDEDELAEAVRIGLVAPDQAAAIRAEGERVIQRLEDRLAPFSAGWDRWQPDPAWPVPRLPDDWERLP